MHTLFYFYFSVFLYIFLGLGPAQSIWAGLGPAGPASDPAGQHEARVN
jgi:hypothetical protein